MLLQLIISGLAVGATYALAALSLVLVYRATNLVNFAQGDMMMFSAFLGVVGYQYMHLPLLVAYALSLSGMVLIGVSTYFLSYKYLRETTVSFMISTIALGLIMQNISGISTKFQPLALPSLFSKNTIRILGASLTIDKLLVIVFAILLIVLLHLFLSKTTLGILLQATAQDQEAAKLSGVRVNQMILITFIVSGVMSGIGGLLLAPLYFVTANLGSLVILKAFAATIIGGFGSVSGAIVGGFLIGLVEILATAYVSNDYGSAITFGLLVLALLFFPSGIFGERASVRV